VSGLGKNPRMQVQIAAPAEFTEQSVLGPHGLGLQGSTPEAPIRNIAGCYVILFKVGF
jgi:hypothetical protein